MASTRHWRTSAPDLVALLVGPASAAMADVTERSSSIATGVVVFNQPNHDCTGVVRTWQGNVVSSFRLNCQQQSSPNQCQQDYSK